MTEPTSDTDPWLTITEAAEQLGVHPTTLRRWADQGEIPVMLTPGGHRRFATADLVRFADSRRRVRALAGLEQVWAEKALSHTRQEIISRPGSHWMEPFDESGREQKRQLGRRMLGLMLQYVSRAEGGEHLLEEAKAIGREHAESALQHGMPLTAALEATMFFRDALVETALQLPESIPIQPKANLPLLRRINQLLNAVQLAIVETYEAVE